MKPIRFLPEADFGLNYVLLLPALFGHSRQSRARRKNMPAYKLQHTSENTVVENKVKSSKPAACSSCTGTDLIRKITTFTVFLAATPNMTAKQVNVGRVALYECQSCGNKMPTPAGKAKVERCIGQMLHMFSTVSPR